MATAKKPPDTLAVELATPAEVDRRNARQRADARAAQEKDTIVVVFLAALAVSLGLMVLFRAREEAVPATSAAAAV
jgi:hypothetical protein